MNNGKLVGLRKFLIGMTFIIFNSVLAGIILFIVPADNLIGAFGAFSSVIVTESAGVFGIVYGNVKENQAKANGGVRG
jgi:hypothetical protein